MDMHCKENRLKTFINWPVKFLSPEIFAENGFYYMGYDDVVCCAFCKIEIMSWIEGDDPAVDHLRWSPNCPLLQKKEDEEIFLLKNQVSKVNVPLFPGTLSRIESNKKSLTIRPTPVHPQYASFQTRLSTFKDWPRSMSQKPEDLADAGFYYTGTGDKAQCFFCGGGLKDWERDDDPWKEHALWFPTCFFISIFKDFKFKQAIPPTPRKQIQLGTLEKQLAEVKISSKTEKPPDKVKDGNIDKLCSICCVDKSNAVIIPCGHICVCVKCATVTDKCPTCRGSIDDSIRLYFS
ncbi:death-associated inhibitor of apoptosis 1-like [Aphomia sociella]